MNARPNAWLIAGATIVALVFGGIFVAYAHDMGWRDAALTMAIGFGVAALLIVGVFLLVIGMERR